MTHRFGLARGIALAALAACASAALAQGMGTAFTYQGRLANNGVPATGLYDLRFVMYASPSAQLMIAGPIYVEDVQVTNGLFSVQVDFGNVSGATYNGNERWLSVGVRPGNSPANAPYTLLNPRQELTPTPYAITADHIAVPCHESGSSNAGLLPSGLFSIYQTGTAAAILGTSNSSGAGVFAQNVGSGPGLKAVTTGPCCDSPAVEASSDNYRAGEFIISNPSNPHIALYAEHIGSGYALMGYNRGTGKGVGGFNNGSTGEAGYFRIGNSQNASPALFCESLGSGPALRCAGRAVVEVLEITGADVAEKFPVSEATEPGMVMAIDPANPGKLCLARGAYNKRVAGVVSGANGLNAGTILGNLPGHETAPPIALSGRVWVHCDATEKAIEPGDLMTTSDRAGHAMAVTDGSKAAGATIGKAMTALAKGETGMVLVLVNLQ